MPSSCRHRAHAFANNYACNGRLTLTLPLIPDDAMSGRKEQPRAIIALDLSKSMRIRDEKVLINFGEIYDYEEKERNEGTTFR